MWWTVYWSLDLLQVYSIKSHSSGTEAQQVPYWVLDQIAHLCVAVYSMVCSLLSSYMLPEQITHQSYSISEDLHSGISVKAFVPSVYWLSDLPYGVV